MFTGIIEELGTVERIDAGAHSAVLHLRAQQILDDLHLGDSVAVNGVCLTVTALPGHGFCADVMHETLNRSSLGALRPGSRVNLERAMAANGRFGGHIVAGHVDATGTIAQIRRDDNAIWYGVNAPEQIMRLVIEKGSIALDGISLTVAKVESGRFWISAIPHTVRQTVLCERRVGDRVNLETDVIGKYVQALMTAPQTPQSAPSGLSMEFLERCGF